jgi:tetratricopeptide (TPR) repeat protein
VVAAALAALGAVLAGGLVAAGNPVHRVESAWHSFKGGYGSNSHTGSRLVSGLGSNRYDFYRVALDQFVDHPLAGIGADNYQQQYLAHGRSDETPRYPHSVELRTLAETGVVGALLAVGGLVGLLLAGRRALQMDDRLGVAAAAAALAGFAYWLVHGSFDWFFEFAGLGGPAFALAGIVCGLAPEETGGAAQAAGANSASTDPDSAAPPARGPARSRPMRLPALAAAALGAVVVLGAAYSLAAPWLSQLQLQSAARIWTHAPRAAYSRLQDAADLNPLSDQAYVLAGSIALRYGELARADASFAKALQRTPGDAYATLERGAIASQLGMRAVALNLLERAVALAPRDPLAREALALVRHGGRVSVEALNRRILFKAQQLS